MVRIILQVQDRSLELVDLQSRVLPPLRLPDTHVLSPIVTQTRIEADSPIVSIPAHTILCILIYSNPV